MHFKHASVPLTNAKKKLSDISSKIFAPLTSNNSFLPTRVNSKFHYPRATKLQQLCSVKGSSPPGSSSTAGAQKESLLQQATTKQQHTGLQKFCYC